MKKTRLLSIGCSSVVALLLFAAVGRAQPQCVTVSPHEVKARIIVALQALPPEQAQQTVAAFESLPADRQQASLELLRRTLQLLPPHLHQSFINGVFGVSPDEAQFAAEVLRQVGARVAAGAQLPAACSFGQA